MCGKYSDMISLSPLRYDGCEPMSLHDRAAQFSPFAALVGYDDAVEETARYTDKKRELTEDEAETLNARLAELGDRLSEQPEIRVSFFTGDPRKQGGCYTVRSGRVRIIDWYEGALVFTDGARIGLSELEWLEFTENGSEELGAVR